MKRASRIWAICAVMLMGAWGVKGEEARVKSGMPKADLDTIRLDLQGMLETYPMDGDGKWEETYNSDITGIGDDFFILTHITNGGSGGMMSYWDGFTLCTSGDDTDYGQAGSSDGWIDHQWGCMAGGGLNAAKKAEKGMPYLVAYWGGKSESDDSHSLQADFGDGMSHTPVCIWICNHPWPYYGIEHDDGFAHSFADNGAYFRLIIHGLDSQGKEAGEPVAVTLASFHDDRLHISKDWQRVDLTGFGQIHGLYFTMESSDNAGSLGMNTAAYFCVGGLEILEHEDKIERPAGLEAEALDENRVRVTWVKADGAKYYNVYTDSEKAGTTTKEEYTFEGLQAYSEHKFYVEAVSEHGQVSDRGYVTARTLDLTAPAAPGNLRAEAEQHKIKLSWDAGTDNIGVSRYAVYVDGKRYSRPKGTSVTITGLDADKTYKIEVSTLDLSDNESERVSIEVKTLPENATAIRDTQADGQTTVYNIQGQRTQRADRGGVYIVKDGQETKKIIRR